MNVSGIRMSRKDDWLKNLLLNSYHSDVVIVLKGDKDLELPAHSLILRTHSQVFDRMLDKNKFQEGSTRRIVLQDFEYSLVKYFLRFLYTQDLPDVSLGTQIQLLQLAHLYQVKDLMKLCEDRIFPKLTQDNACGLLDTVSLYSETLKIACRDVIARYAFLIFPNERHLDLSSESLAALLSHARLYVVNEEQVIQGLLCWGEDRCWSLGMQPDRENMKKQIEDLLKLVRWRQVTDISHFAPYVELLTESKNNTGVKRPAIRRKQGQNLLQSSCSVKFNACVSCGNGGQVTENVTVELLSMIFKKPVTLVGITIELEIKNAMSHNFTIDIISDRKTTVKPDVSVLLNSRIEGSDQVFYLEQFDIVLRSPLIIPNSLRINLTRNLPLTVIKLKKHSNTNYTEISEYVQAGISNPSAVKAIYFYPI